MHSEWMKVMLAEIERKQRQARDERMEQQTRAAEGRGSAASGVGVAKKRPRRRR